MKWKFLVDMALWRLLKPWVILVILYKADENDYFIVSSHMGGASHPEYIPKIYINTSVENVGFQMYKFYLYNMINGLIPTRF